MFKNYFIVYFLVIQVFDAYCKNHLCVGTFTDENGNSIELKSFCKTKPCITKCCKLGYILGHNKTCVLKSNVTKEMEGNQQNVHFIDHKIYYFDKSADIMKISDKNISRNFNFVYNKSYKNASCYYSNQKNHYIMEDGSLTAETPHAYKRWMPVDQMAYCVDIWLNDKNLQPQFIYLKLRRKDSDTILKTLICGISMVISSFFLLLVFLVYAVLPQLQNIGGMMLMAYVATLAAAYLLRGASDMEISVNRFKQNRKFCKHITPAYYFAILASFFWLNVMSFDIWWALRASNSKSHRASRREELVQFLWYSLYAYGFSILMTGAAIIVDTPGVITLTSFLTPMFETCFASKNEIFYLLVPVGILTASNCILFCITSYNIWLVNRRVKESLSLKRNENRFKVYVKLSLVMGVSWVLEFLELITGELPVYLFVLVNAYNMLIGVAVFFMFVFKKTIFIMLCKRWNIQNSLVEKYQRSCI